MEENGFDFQGGGIGQQAPPVPDPWTTADEQRLDRLNQGLSGLQKQHDEGTLAPEEFQPLYDRVNSMRGPLLQKQQGYAQQMQQQQQQQALHANAQTQAVRLHDAAFDAQTFGGRMYRHVDERTGEETNFYQTEPGKWAPMDKPDQAEGTGVADYVSALVGSQEEDQAQAEMLGGPNLEEGSGGGNPPQQPEAGAQPLPSGVPAAPQTSKQTIQNGPYTEENTRDQSGNIISRSYPNGTPPWAQGGQQQNQLFGLDARTMGQVNAIAQAQTMHMRPGVHRDVAQARIKGQLVAGVIAENARQERQKASQQLIQDRAAASEKKLTATQRAARNAGFTPHDVYDMTKKEEEHLAKSEDETVTDFEHGGKLWGGLVKDLPHEVRQAIADQRIRSRLERIGGASSTPAAATPAAAPAEPAAPAQPAAPKIEPLPASKATLADVQAEIARRQRAREGPGLLERISSEPAINRRRD